MRVTPTLGPAAPAVGPAGQYYYDAGQPGYSPQLGVTTLNDNGLKEVYAVSGAAALTAAARVNIDFATGIATANASGLYVAPAAVPISTPFVAVEYRA